MTRHHVDEVKDAVFFLILVECDTLPPPNDAQLERRTPLHINRPIFWEAQLSHESLFLCRLP